MYIYTHTRIGRFWGFRVLCAVGGLEFRVRNHAMSCFERLAGVGHVGVVAVIVVGI